VSPAIGLLLCIFCLLFYLRPEPPVFSPRRTY
jgi:hypothetical protein